MRKTLTLLVLFFAAAAILVEGLALLRTNNRRGRLHDRWETPAPLFCTLGWGQRSRLAAPLFFAALVLLQLDRVLWQSSQLYSHTGEGLMRILGLFYPAIFLLLAVKTLLCTQYTLRQFLTALGVFVLVAFALSANYEYGFFAACGFLLAAKDIDFAAALKVSFFSTLFSVLVLAALTAAGILGNYSTFVREGEGARLIFGFQHPSLFGMYTMSLVVVLAVLRFQKHPLPQLVFFAFGFFCVWRLADSRSNTLALLVFAAVMAAAKFAPALFRLRPVQALLTAAPVLCSGVSLLAAYAYNEATPVWQKLNILSSSRLYLYHLATAFSPSLRGQKVIGGQLNVPGDLYALDNSYLYLFYYGGVLLAATAVVACCFLMRKVLSEGRVELAAALICWLTFGMLEQYFFYPWANAFLLLFTPLVYRQKLPAVSAAPLAEPAAV